MLQYFDPKARFQSLIDEVSNYIENTDLSDFQIAETCSCLVAFVRAQRRFISLGPYTCLEEEDEMPRRTIEIAYDDLYREYVENQNTIEESAEIFDCSPTHIQRKLGTHGIPKRNPGYRTKSKRAGVGENTNGKPPVVDSESITTIGGTVDPLLLSEEPVTPELKEHSEVVRYTKTRHLERLVLLSVVKGDSIQELLEEALELLFEKYRKENSQ